MTTLARSADPCLDLFSFALDQLTWQHLRDKLPLDGGNDMSAYWTVATAGPLSLLARAATDHHATLSDWTTREDSPELFAKQDRGHLHHVGLIVEVACQGILLSHESCWAICLDFSGGLAERESHEHLLDMLKQLSSEALAYLPKSLDNKISSLQTAAHIITGIEAPYHRSVHF